jgi:uncharacterized membrane protein YvlD (DUF360 family)
MERRTTPRMKSHRMRIFVILAKLVFRYSLVWIADAVSIGFTALVLPGIYFVKESPFWYLDPFVVALWMSLLNVLVRPLLITLLLPINFVSLGLTTLILNSGLFYLAGRLVPSFVIESFPAALVGLFVLSTVNTILANFFLPGDDYSLFSKIMNKLSTLTRPKELSIEKRGLVIVQIDGLSATALAKALRRGKMPYVGDLLARRKYALKTWFAGLPSQTSSAQAGFFYGNNFNIPGFRWYDRKRKKQMVSSNSVDMHEIDERLGGGDDSLLENGTCINTLIHGGAKKKLMALSVILEKDFRRRKSELEDFAIFSLHPYLYNRAIVLMTWDFVNDRIQTLLDIIKKRSPRVKRSIRSSFLRAVGNAFLRESTSFFVMEDIVRGIPVIYVNYIGYDIVAHHTGPLAWHAISVLTGIDRQIRKIGRTIRKKANKQYDIIILSDHGQSRCVPFEWKYGMTLAQFIVERLKTPLAISKGYGPERGYLTTLLNEMRIVEEAYGSGPIRRSRRTMERIHRTKPEEIEEPIVDQGVVVCCTGNLAHIYFTEHAERLTIEELLRIHPSLIESLVTHPGIGFICVKSGSGEVMVIGERGMRKLAEGTVEGEDPLASYDGHERARTALRNLCEYPDSGDVIAMGAMLKNNMVVSFEDQVGTHGGLGGTQTEAFIISPQRTGTPEDSIDNPIDMHRFLKSFSKTIAGKES